MSIPKPQNADQAKMNRLSDLNDQVLVFKYKGFVHAIDNVC
jgi:nitrite reductase/ring-hydroxylating ferredoxin subunit